MAKINKALDLNKLFSQQKQGKLLKKHIQFPMFGSVKYDGNYTTIVVEAVGYPVFYSSGGHIYDNDRETMFHQAEVGVYIAERIAGEGRLGDRSKCSLRGPRGLQTAHNHWYKVHDFITLRDYEDGVTDIPYYARRVMLREKVKEPYLVEEEVIYCQEELEVYLEETVKLGFEGIMVKSEGWLWKHTKSRTIDLVKYKKRPTADLLCIGATEGTGKYAGVIGSLRLTDKTGRIVDVGSGMSDLDRTIAPSHYIGRVIEVFYEQIMDTYIQPTFGDEYEGVLIRHDKTKEEID